MRKRLAIMMIVAAAICAQAFADTAGASGVSLFDVQGEVSTRINADAEWADAKDGAALPVGALVKTNAEARAALLWADGHAVRIFPLSVVKVDVERVKDIPSGAKLSLEKGRLAAKVAKLASEASFTIETPVAVTGVRGTSFDCSLSAEGDKLIVAVVEGEVFVTAEDVEIEIAQGMMSAVSAGEPPTTPVEIPPSTLIELKKTDEELSALTEELSAEPDESPADSAKSDVIDNVIDKVIEQTTQDAIMDSVIDNVQEDHYNMY